MANSSTYSFGSGTSVAFTQQELVAGSSRFITKDSDLSKKLGSEIFRGEFSVDKGLIAFDSSPLFTPQSSTASNTNQTTTSNQTEPSPPSTRPYVWKYQ
jgi:hypothetical protein